MKIYQEDQYWYVKCDNGMIHMPYANQTKTYGPQKFKDCPEVVYSWSDTTSDGVGDVVRTYTLLRAGKKEFMIYQRFHRFVWSKNELSLSEEHFVKPIKPPRIPDPGPAYKLVNGTLVSTVNPKIVIRADSIGDRATSLLKDWQKRFDDFISDR